MLTLKQTCELCIMRMMIKHLQMRKKMIEVWMISFADWVIEMKLDTLKLWFSSLPSVMVQSIMETTMSQLTQARDRDLLLCILTISLTPSTTKFLVPSCMSLDETSRLYVLELLCRETTWESLHTFCCESYKPGSIHYMSQQVRLIVTTITQPQLNST